MGLAGARSLERSQRGNMYESRTFVLQLNGPSGLKLAYGKHLVARDQHPAICEIASHVSESVSNFRRGDLVVELDGEDTAFMEEDDIELALRRRPVTVRILRQPLDLSYSLFYPKRNFPPPPYFDGFADFTTESLKLPVYTPATDYIPPAEDQDTLGVTSGHFGSWSPKSDWADRTMSPQRTLPFFDNAFFVQSPTQTARFPNRSEWEEELASKTWGTRTLDFCPSLTLPSHLRAAKRQNEVAKRQNVWYTSLVDAKNKRPNQTIM